MTGPTKEERLEAARRRTQENIENKNSFGVQGKGVLDLEKIGGYKKEMFYKPKSGMNHLDFIPYLVTGKHPQQVKIGYPDYILDVRVHRFVGASKSTFVCLEAMYGKPCPICEAREKMKSDPDATDKEIKKLYPKRRCWYNVIDLDSKNPNQPVQIFEESHYLFEGPMLEIIKVKNNYDFWDIENGTSVEFLATEKQTPEGKHFDYGQFYFEKRQPYGDDIYKEAYNLAELLYIPSYEEVRNAFLGIDDDEELPVEEAKPVERTRSRGEAPTEEPQRTRSRGIGAEIADETKDQLKEETPARTRTRQPVADEADNRCPFKLRFGVDSDSSKTCTQCDQKIWNECADEHDKIAAGK